MLRNLFFKNIVLLDQAMYSGASFVMTLLLSQALGLSLFGVFSTYILALFLISSISQALLIQPMQTRTADLRDNPDYTQFLFVAALGFIVFVALFVFVFSIIGPMFFPIAMNTILAFGLYLYFFLLHDFLRKFFLAKNEAEKTFKLDFFYLISLCLSLGAIWIFDIRSLTQIFVLLAFSILPVVVFFLIKNLKACSKRTHKNIFLKHHLKEGKWFLMAGISQWFSSNIFVLSSGVFLSIEALGALRLVQTVFGLMNIFLQSVENFIIPQVNLLVSNSIPEAQTYLNGLLKKSILILIPFLGFIFYFSSDVIYFLGGEEYLPYHEAIKGFCVLYLIIFLLYPIRILIRALGYNKSFFIAYLLSLAFGLVFSPFLLKNLGLNGAILGFIGSQFILCTVWLTFLSKQKIQLWKLYI